VHLYWGDSLGILTVRAFDYYLAICRPLCYHALMTTSRIIAGIWLTNLVLASSPTSGYNNPSLMKLIGENTTANNMYGLVNTLLMQGATMLTVLFTYGHMATCILNRRLKNQLN
ncbi:hypothetical protein NHX12_010314, partial [Muraenolepis orangiensis]